MSTSWHKPLHVWTFLPCGFVGSFVFWWRFLVCGWMVKRVLTQGGDSWVFESTTAVVGDEEKLSKELFTVSCLFSVKGVLRWMESVTMKGYRCLSHIHTHTPGEKTHRQNLLIKTWKKYLHICTLTWTRVRVKFICNMCTQRLIGVCTHMHKHKSTDICSHCTHTCTHSRMETTQTPG